LLAIQNSNAIGDALTSHHIKIDDHASGVEMFKTVHYRHLRLQIKIPINWSCISNTFPSGYILGGGVPKSNVCHAFMLCHRKL
jgi:hypothetical protein